MRDTEMTDTTKAIMDAFQTGNMAQILGVPAINSVSLQELPLPTNSEEWYQYTTDEVNFFFLLPLSLSLLLSRRVVLVYNIVFSLAASLSFSLHIVWGQCYIYEVTTLSLSLSLSLIL